MTRQEAIEIIKSAHFFAPSEVDVDGAIEMAIRSLEALEKIDDLVHKTYWSYPIGIDYCIDNLEEILKEVDDDNV